VVVMLSGGNASPERIRQVLAAAMGQDRYEKIAGRC